MPPDAYASLKMLADMGRFGKNPNEVARYLLLREIDDLTRAGVLREQEAGPHPGGLRLSPCDYPPRSQCPLDLHLGSIAQGSVYKL